MPPFHTDVPPLSTTWLLFPNCRSCVIVIVAWWLWKLSLQIKSEVVVYGLANHRTHPFAALHETLPPSHCTAGLSRLLREQTACRMFDLDWINPDIFPLRQISVNSLVSKLMPAVNSEEWLGMRGEGKSSGAWQQTFHLADDSGTCCFAERNVVAGWSSRGQSTENSGWQKRKRAEGRLLSIQVLSVGIFGEDWKETKWTWSFLCCSVKRQHIPSQRNEKRTGKYSTIPKWGEGKQRPIRKSQRCVSWLWQKCVSLCPQQRLLWTLKDHFRKGWPPTNLSQNNSSWSIEWTLDNAGQVTRINFTCFVDGKESQATGRRFAESWPRIPWCVSESGVVQTRVGDERLQGNIENSFRAVQKRNVMTWTTTCQKDGVNSRKKNGRKLLSLTSEAGVPWWGFNDVPPREIQVFVCAAERFLGRARLQVESA